MAPAENKSQETNAWENRIEGLKQRIKELEAEISGLKDELSHRRGADDRVKELEAERDALREAGKGMLDSFLVTQNLEDYPKNSPANVMNRLIRNSGQCSKYSTIAALLERMEREMAKAFGRGMNAHSSTDPNIAAKDQMAEIRKEMDVEPQTCKWTPNPASDGEYYDAECGVFGMSLHVTNQAKVCHGCGRPVEVVREEEQG